MFERTTYVKRRNQLTKLIESGLLLLLGNEESPMNYRDNTYPFRQDSNFLYYTGLDRPGLALLIDVDEGKATLFGEAITVEHIVWMGPQPGLDEQAESSGIEQAVEYERLPEALRTARQAGRTIHYLPPYRHDAMIRLHQWLDVPLDSLAQGASRAFIKAVIAQRSYKTEEEVAEMERALTITGRMHVAAMKAARAGIREARLAGIVSGIAHGAGGQLAYPAIVTINGQTLHNHYHGNRLSAGRLVLGDFGAETDRHYAGDITRSFPVDGTFTERQKAVYEVVLRAQLAAIEALKPGERYLDVHLLAARIIAEGLREMGILKGAVDDAVGEGAHALFFPHGLGHMIGLDVHDMEDLGEDLVGYTAELPRSDQFGLRSLRLARTLEPGFVLTVEPGIYFIPELIRQWQAEGRHLDFINYDRVQDFIDFSGIRIEDNLLITADGYRLLGPPIPKSVEEVEATCSAQ